MAPAVIMGGIDLQSSDVFDEGWFVEESIQHLVSAATSHFYMTVQILFSHIIILLGRDEKIKEDSLSGE